jgi:hypothetical protein
LLRNRGMPIERQRFHWKPLVQVPVSRLDSIRSHACGSHTERDRIRGQNDSAMLPNLLQMTHTRKAPCHAGNVSSPHVNRNPVLPTRTQPSEATTAAPRLTTTVPQQADQAAPPMTRTRRPKTMANRTECVLLAPEPGRSADDDDPYRSSHGDLDGRACPRRTHNGCRWPHQGLRRQQSQKIA